MGVQAIFNSGSGVVCEDAGVGQSKEVGVSVFEVFGFGCVFDGDVLDVCSFCGWFEAEGIGVDGGGAVKCVLAEI